MISVGEAQKQFVAVAGWDGVQERSGAAWTYAGTRAGQIKTFVGAWQKRTKDFNPHRTLCVHCAAEITTEQDCTVVLTPTETGPSTTQNIKLKNSVENNRFIPKCRTGVSAKV